MPDIFNCGVSIKINRFVFVGHKCPTYKLATPTKGSLKTQKWRVGSSPTFAVCIPAWLMTPAAVGCAASLRTPFTHLATSTKGSLKNKTAWY